MISAHQEAQPDAGEAPVVTGFQGEGLWRVYARVYELMERISFVREQHARHVRALFGLPVVLDAGCGIGSSALQLAEGPDRMVLALDRNEAMLGATLSRLTGSGHAPPAVLIRGDVLALPCGNASVDGYLSNNVLQFVDNENQLVREMTRVTRPGGRASIASARRVMDVELLLDAMEKELREDADSTALQDFATFAAVNRSLKGALRNAHEPEELSEMLERSGCWRTLEATTSYLEQDFFVVAVRL